MGGIATMNTSRWSPRVVQIVRGFLMALAVLNAWISYTIFPQHPVMAVANAIMVVILVYIIVLAWGA